MDRHVDIFKKACKMLSLRLLAKEMGVNYPNLRYQATAGSNRFSYSDFQAADKVLRWYNLRFNIDSEVQFLGHIILESKRDELFFDAQRKHEENNIPELDYIRLHVKEYCECCEKQENPNGIADVKADQDSTDMPKLQKHRDLG